MHIPRISAEAARQHGRTGDALLVCADDGDRRCRLIRPEGALCWAELERRLPYVPATQEIILYCTAPREAKAAARCEELMAVGFQDVKAVRGGLDAWLDARLPFAVPAATPEVPARHTQHDAAPVANEWRY